MKNSHQMYAKYAVTVCLILAATLSGAHADTGDSCYEPFEIFSLPYTDNYFTDFLYDDTISSCSQNSDGPDAVYSFTPDADIVVDISLCNSQFDTVLYVYEGCEGVEIACSDDDCGDSLQSQIIGLSLTADQDYYIVVDGYDSGEYGEYEIIVTESGSGGPCGPPIVAIDDLDHFYPTDSLIDITGSAYDPNGNFNQWVLKYTGANMDQWEYVTFNPNEVVNNTLLVWDTTGLEPGAYTLELYAFTDCPGGSEFAEDVESINLGFPGDLNRDNTVNGTDYAIFALNWLREPIIIIVE